MKSSAQELFEIAYKTLLENSTEQGFLASGKQEVYGALFGRDSALTILKVLKAQEKSPSLELLDISRRTLLTLVSLQGKEVNFETNEEPGKFIHEFRKADDSLFNKFATAREEDPWFIDPQGYIKNYDSIDSTPLILIAIYKYWQITQDGNFLMQVLPAVENGLNWMITYGDRDKDGLLEFSIHFERKHGGPYWVQSWTDSHESLRQKNGQMPMYPIAPIEVQSYAWLALKLWSDFYQTNSPKYARKLLSQAKRIKKSFNKLFIYKENGQYFGAQALDGYKNQIKTVTANPLICLWATYYENGKKESILENRYIEHFIKRAFKEDLFDPEAGIRTMSTTSSTYNPNRDSYHNGSFWVILNGLVEEGVREWEYLDYANALKEATIKPLLHFNCPIEMYIKDESGNYHGYLSSGGQESCMNQTWSAAAMYEMLI